MKTPSAGKKTEKKASDSQSLNSHHVDKLSLTNMVFQIFLIREFEQILLKLWTDGCVNGPVHTGIGHEACAVGAITVLNPTDVIGSTHRAHHHYISKVINYYSSKGFDALAGKFPDSAQKEITSLMGEVMGLKNGCCGGRGGSMHLRNDNFGVLGTNAIVAGGVPATTGAAFAAMYNKSKQVVVCFLGDGALNQGAFHEAANLAGLWNLPVIYFIENNMYAVGTNIRNSRANQDLLVLSDANGLYGMSVDGMDPLAVMQTMQQAVTHVRGGNGPVLINAECYRWFHHNGPVPGSAFGYRDKKEEVEWQKKDPCEQFPLKLIRNSDFSDEEINEIKSLAIETVNAATGYCTFTENNKYVVREELWPASETLETGIRSNASEFEGIQFKEAEDFSEWETQSYVNTISSVIGKHLQEDEKTFVIGLEVANFGGGAHGATKKLPSTFPSRIINAPISECGFTGLAGGAAMSGLKPIVEIMFANFVMVAADQLFNQICNWRHIYNNTVDVPLVLRCRVAMASGFGGQHSLDTVGIFSLFNGWRIIAPSNAFDYIGLFNTAMLSRDPVVIMEHHTLYPETFKVPKGSLDYFIPFGKARIVEKGKDVSVVSYASGVELARRAAEELSTEGISTEVIDLRTLSTNDIDYEILGQSLRKTGAMVIVEKTQGSACIGPKIAHYCQEQFFDYLDVPIVTVGGADVPTPVSKKLEIVSVPDIDTIKKTIRMAARRLL